MFTLEFSFIQWVWTGKREKAKPFSFRNGMFLKLVAKYNSRSEVLT